MLIYSEDKMDCAAFLIGSNNDANSLSHKIATSAGFSAIESFISLRDVEKQIAQTPIVYFLFEEVSDISKLNEVIKRIRKCKRNNVRFLPLIYLCNAPKTDIINQIISLGFDDIITKPSDFLNAAKRLKNQLDNQFTYFETDNFFGPDRRRKSDNNLSKGVARGVEQCLQIKFNRDVEKGVEIISKKIQAA